MLREDIVEAADKKTFNIWAVDTIDEGIEVLTGEVAGDQLANGTWPPGSLNERIDSRLREYAESLKSFGHRADGGERAERRPAEIGPRTPRLDT